jgi:hypothetical protein
MCGLESVDYGLQMNRSTFSDFKPTYSYQSPSAMKIPMLQENKNASVNHRKLWLPAVNIRKTILVGQIAGSEKTACLF